VLFLVIPEAGAQEIGCAASADFPCDFQMRAVDLQRVPTTFKFQSRISQSKLPVGEGVFNTVIVKVLRGTDVLCMEEFAAVQVRDSVLNLEIGRNMSCELDEVIAENSELAFQICLGGAGNCLKPIALATMPYAVKASFSTLAQQAHEANVASQSHYAHRVTADRDLFVRHTIGTGYFDFYTQPQARAGSLYDAAAFTEFEHGGFLQWTPVGDRTALNLHIVGKDQSTDSLAELNKLVLAADNTVATGNLRVQPPAGAAAEGLTVESAGIHVQGDSDITGATTITGTLSVSDRTEVLEGGIHVGGDSNINGNTDIKGELKVSSRTQVLNGGVHVTGNSDITGDLDVTGNGEVTGTLDIGRSTKVLSGGIQVTGDSNVGGKLRISKATTVESGGITVTGSSVVDGALLTTDKLTVRSGGVEVTGAGSISGDAVVGGTLEAGDKLTVLSGGASVKGNSVIDGTLETSKGVTVKSGGVKVSGSSEVAGHFRVAGDTHLYRDLQVDDALLVNGPVSMKGKSNAVLVEGPTTFLGHVVFAGGQSILPVELDQRYVAMNDQRNVGLGADLLVTGVARAAAFVTHGVVAAEQGFELGPVEGDPVSRITSRLIPADQGGGAERSELILFHGNDGSIGSSGPDMITLRAPQIRLQTYDNPAVDEIDDAGGSVDRIVIDPDGAVDVHGPVTFHEPLVLARGLTTIDDMEMRHVEAQTGSIGGSLTAGSLSAGTGTVNGNLTVHGVLDARGNADVDGTLAVHGSTTLASATASALTVSGAANVHGYLHVYGFGEFDDGVDIDAELTVDGRTHCEGGIDGAGTLYVKIDTSACVIAWAQDTGWDGYKVTCPDDYPIMRHMVVDEDSDWIDYDDSYAQCCRLKLY